MDYALLLISVFAVFIPALLLPGPDFVAVVRSSMTYAQEFSVIAFAYPCARRAKATQVCSQWQ